MQLFIRDIGAKGPHLSALFVFLYKFTLRIGRLFLYKNIR